MIHREIIGPHRRPEGDRGKVRVFARALRASDQSNDFCAHDNPSHTAIATRPANASEIRYAVMLASWIFHLVIVGLDPAIHLEKNLED
jgi:hypothetical protein